MRKYLFASLFATTLWSGLSLAEPTYIEKMTSLSAICSLDAMHEETKVWAAAKNMGKAASAGQRASIAAWRWSENV